MTIKSILGIDAGMKGCLAWYDGQELLLTDMPVFEKEGGGHDLDIHKLYKIIAETKFSHCFLEKTTAMPGIAGRTAYSMGKSEGAILGILSALIAPYTLVRPATWKKVMGCPADKNLARKRASEILPQFAHNWDKKKYDGRAESALIALYGWNATK